MKRIIYTVWQISILWGALFFLFPCPNAQAAYPFFDTIPVLDTLHIKDSIPVLHRPDSLYIAITNSKETPAKREAVRTDTTTSAWIKKKKMPSPQRSTILSAVLPGLGQAYNGKYWKIPIIYAVGAGLYYAYDQNNKQFQYYRIQYSIDKISGTATQTEIDTDELRRDEYAKWRNYCVIGLGILYVANIVDAMTDAYFRQYDISSDLSLKVSPLILPEPIFAAQRYRMNYGVSLSFQF